MGVENLMQAIRARRDVWQNQRDLGTALLALANLEGFVPDRVEERKLQTLDHRVRRLLLLQPEQKLLQPFRRTFDFDEDAL